MDQLVQSYDKMEKPLNSQSIGMQNNDSQFSQWLATITNKDICAPLVIPASEQEVCIWYEDGICQQYYSRNLWGDLNDAALTSEDLGLANPFDYAFEVLPEDSVPKVIKPKQNADKNNESVTIDLPSSITLPDPKCSDIFDELKNSVQLQDVLDHGCTHSQPLFQQVLQNGSLGPLLNATQKYLLELELNQTADANETNLTWVSTRILRHLPRCPPRLICNCLLSNSLGESYCPTLSDLNAVPSACDKVGNDSFRIDQETAQAEHRKKYMKKLSDMADKITPHLNDPPE